MATRSNIGILNADGTVTGVYCHNDGYPEHHGPRLLGYETEEAARSVYMGGRWMSIAEALADRGES